MDVNIPEPNRALTELLVSARMRAIVEERANTAAMLYQAQVAKRTGRLAASAHASTEIGGVRQDRWIGVLTVGSALPYGASHEFGTRAHGQTDAAHDLNRVLEQLGSL
ncbi:MAG: hypothetical protein K2Q25_02415 [Mycobacteriaceae bacterium]|nr:hypothetical protein [Mycobacteriaceae bacterium]